MEKDNNSVNFTVPRVDPLATIHVGGPIIVHAPDDSIPVTGKILVNCAKYTGRHAVALIAAFEVLNFKPIDVGGGDNWCADGILLGFNMLMKLASPTWFLLLVGIHLPKTAGGLLGTIVMTPVYACEWLYRTARYYIKGKSTPSVDAMKLREHLTQQFINRMKLMLGEMNELARDHFLQYPERLVSIVAIAVAFLSRHELEGLKVGNEVLKIENLATQDETRKQYFRDICEIKEAIQGLNLTHLEDIKAWSILMQRILSCKEEGDEGAELPKKQGDGKDEKESGTPNFELKIVTLAGEFGEKVVKDEVFHRLWLTQKL